MNEVSGRRILITGGASGIGAATARLFSDLGAIVIIADVQDELGHQLANDLGAPHSYVHLDVSDPAAWAALVATIDELDILFLNAGRNTRPSGQDSGDDPLGWISPEDFSRSVAVNLGGAVYGVHACLPLLAKCAEATILITSSSAGIRPYIHDPLYVMAKYGLVGLVGSLGPTLEERGIRIVCICPAGIETPMWSRDAVERKRAAGGKFSTPEFMAQAVLDIYRQARSGEVWIGGEEQPARRHETPPFMPKWKNPSD